jgi:hypothetical protein
MEINSIIHFLEFGVDLATFTEKMFYKTPFLAINNSVFKLFLEAEELKNKTTPTSLLGIKLTEEDVPLISEIFSSNQTIPTFADFLEYILSTDLLGKLQVSIKVNL